MDPDERRLFEEAIAGAAARCTGPALDDALDEIGWTDALAAEPRDAVAVLFEHLGRTGARCAGLDRLMASVLAPGEPAAVVLPPLGTWDPPAVRHGETLVVDGLGSAAAATGLPLVVAALPREAGDTGETGGDTTVLVIPSGGLTIAPVAGIDPALGLHRIHGRVEVGLADQVAVAAPDGSAGTEAWSRAVALARLALGHELVGVGRTMLELARTHAIEREQFDRPIGSFQAVRHRLADTLVAIEMAEAALDAGWLDEDPVNAAMAKAVAGRGARTAARHCQQVLAGIGFTTEHPFHLFLRRAYALDGMLGSAATISRWLGARVLADRRLPRPLPL